MPDIHTQNPKPDNPYSETPTGIRKHDVEIFYGLRYTF